MHKLYFILLSCTFLFGTTGNTHAQTPGVKSTKYFSLSQWNPVDFVYDAKPTTDGSIILAGVDSAWDYSRQEVLNRSVNTHGRLCKVDSSGNRIWSILSPVPYRADAYTCVMEVANGGIVGAGYDGAAGTPSIIDFYISKHTSDGQPVWGKVYGGSNDDIAYALAAFPESGYLVAGASSSNDGFVSGNHGSGTSDAWIIKLADDGNIAWQKCYGGSLWDTAFSAVPTPDGGFIVAGCSNSVDGDLAGNSGDTDGWIFKIDNTGNLIWSKNFGGTGNDVLRAITASGDGGYIISGYTDSQNDGAITGNHGQVDVWVVKIDGTGNLLWSKCFGGTADEFALNIQRTLNNEFVIGGFTESADADISGNNGGSDMWTILLSAGGDLIWQKCVGTSGTEYGAASLWTRPNEYVAIGFGPNPVPVPWDFFDVLMATLGNTNTIKGTVFLDENLNGIKDAGEGGFDQVTIKSEKAGLTSFAVPQNGGFKLTTDEGAYTTTLTLNRQYYTVAPASHVSSFTGYFNTDSIGFAIQPLPFVKDLSVNMYSTVTPRPGFPLGYRLLYNNPGTATINNVVLTLQKNPKLLPVFYQPVPATETPTTVSWQLGNLAPGVMGIIVLQYSVATPPVVNNGDTLTMTAWIDPVSGDVTPADDTVLLKSIVRGSFDPNDKTEANAGIITPAQVNDGEYLNYLIRFQNTGTDTAFTVYVRDTLSAKLDWNSFEMVNASHSYNLQIADGDKLTWTFNDIKLADSFINEPASHGYIAYRIKPKPTVVLGDTIHNTASIYFDFNLPVETNNAFTLVMNNVALPVNLSAFTAKLNGHVVDVSWKTASESNVKQFEVQRSLNGVDYVTIGIVRAKNAANGASYAYTDNNPVNGYNYYRLKTVDADESSKLSAIVIVNVNSEVNIVSAVYPNPTTGQVILRLQGKINGNVRLQVMDQFGRELLSKQYGQQNTSQLQSTLELGKLSKGNYILRVYVGDKVYLHKVVVQ